MHASHVKVLFRTAGVTVLDMTGVSVLTLTGSG